MKVYLIQEGCYHDGWTEIGIYSSYEKALEVVNKLLALSKHKDFKKHNETAWLKDEGYDFIRIDEIELDFTDEAHFEED